MLYKQEGFVILFNTKNTGVFVCFNKSIMYSSPLPILSSTLTINMIKSTSFKVFLGSDNV